MVSDGTWREIVIWLLLHLGLKISPQATLMTTRKYIVPVYLKPFDAHCCHMSTAVQL